MSASVTVVLVGFLAGYALLMLPFYLLWGWTAASYASVTFLLLFTWGSKARSEWRDYKRKTGRKVVGCHGVMRHSWWWNGYVCTVCEKRLYAGYVDPLQNIGLFLMFNSNNLRLVRDARTGLPAVIVADKLVERDGG